MIPFVPRSVSKESAKTTYRRAHPIRPSGQAAAPQDVKVVKHPAIEAADKTSSFGTNTTDKEQWITLLYLSTSEYALWANADLRRGQEMSNDGYISLAYILGHSSYFTAETRITEASLAKAIRTFGMELFEVRMSLTNPSRAGWYGKDISHEAPKGGFEIRRKDWHEVLSRARNRNRQYWQDLSIYIEGIPLQHRSLHGIAQLTQKLIEPEASRMEVQDVSLPRHFQDKPTDTPKCKGFALVILSTPVHVRRLLDRWPWQRRSHNSDADGAPSEHEARKFGFRVLPKSKWDKLNEKYLSYRQSLLKQLADAEKVEIPVPAVSEEVERQPTAQAPRPAVVDVPERRQPGITTPSSYPLDCLVFVRNVHPEANKTTLRSLFSCAFASPELKAPPGEGLDYVDFNKGMNTCFLRLATPSHANVLLDYFSSTPLVQIDGLDAAGHEPSDKQKPISMELVTGTREQFYWDKVPEKIRKQAIERAMACTTDTSRKLEGKEAEDDGKEELQTTSKRRRKKRKMDT